MGLDHGYKYETLPNSQAIRLLNLHPGSHDEPIECSLAVVGIYSGQLQYEAISYAWGGLPKSRSILCNGQDLQVTESLFTALQCFRSSHHVRILWADAICIDQENMAEKSSQINLMGQVYRNASKVLVWLGLEDDKVVQSALNGICRYLNSSCLDSLEHQHPSYLWYGSTVEPHKADNLSQSIEEEGIEGISQICSCSWFGRGWVVQEAALARTVDLYWGNAQINFDWVALAIEHVPKHIFLQEHIRRCNSMSYIRETQQNPQTLMSFHQLLVVCRYFEFTDERDRIYGILGLCTTDSIPGGALFIVPDYELSVTECYQKVTEKLLLEHRDWKVLTRVRHESEPSLDQPSWVLQWNASKFYRQRRCAAPSLASSTEITVSKEICNNHACIVIDGFTIDVVEQLHPLVDFADAAEELIDRQELLRDLSDTQDVNCLACTFGEPFDSSYEECTPRWIAEYHAFLQWNTGGGNQSSPQMDESSAAKAMQLEMAGDFWEHMEYNTKGKSIFTTKKGRLGIGPKFLRTGDVIVFFIGATVPFVLRRAGDLWRFVGETYIYEFTLCRDIYSWNDSNGTTETFRIF